MAVLLGWMVNMVMADRGRAGVDGQSGPGAMLDHQLTGPFGGWMFGDPVALNVKQTTRVECFVRSYVVRTIRC